MFLPGARSLPASGADLFDAVVIEVQEDACRVSKGVALEGASSEQAALAFNAVDMTLGGASP